MKIAWCPVFLNVVLLFNDPLIRFLLCAKLQTASQKVQQFAVEEQRQKCFLASGEDPGNSPVCLQGEWLTTQPATSAARAFWGKLQILSQMSDHSPSCDNVIVSFSAVSHSWVPQLCFEGTFASASSKKFTARFCESQVTGERSSLFLVLWSV